MLLIVGYPCSLCYNFQGTLDFYFITVSPAGLCYNVLFFSLIVIVCAYLPACCKIIRRPIFSWFSFVVVFVVRFINRSGRFL